MTKEKDYKSILLSVPKEDYSGEYQKDILELYKMYIEMTDRISSRRQTANSFFLSINTALVGLVSYIQLGNKNDSLYWVIGIAGIILCLTWHRLIRSYKNMNTGKFNIIHEIENLLPLAIYKAEWQALEHGENKKIYLKFTVVESIVPFVFASIHLFVLLYTFF